MKKQLIGLSLAICVALLAGCAKTTLVPFTPNRSEIQDYRMTDTTIYVFLKTGETYEMRNFTVTADSLVGTIVLRSDGWKIVERRTSRIARNEIATIAVIESQDRSWLFIGAGAVLGIGTAAAVLIAATIAWTHQPGF